MHRKKSREELFLDRVGDRFMGFWDTLWFAQGSGQVDADAHPEFTAQPPGLQVACAHELNVQVTENVHSWGVRPDKKCKKPCHRPSGC